MTIKQFLQKGQYMRLSIDDKWLFWNCNGWNVVQRKRYAKTTKTLLVTRDEEEAVAELIKGNEEYF